MNKDLEIIDLSDYELNQDDDMQDIVYQSAYINALDIDFLNSNLN